MRDHARGKSNKKVVGYRTPSRFKVVGPQANQREQGHFSRPTEAQRSRAFKAK
ncbi:MAG: hypothetical protein WCW02_00075 [Candidatus Buchananbacteria bacterium]